MRHIPLYTRFSRAKESEAARSVYRKCAFTYIRTGKYAARCRVDRAPSSLDRHQFFGPRGASERDGGGLSRSRELAGAVESFFKGVSVPLWSCVGIVILAVCLVLVLIFHFY